jgi:hypothetical protein
MAFYPVSQQIGVNFVVGDATNTHGLGNTALGNDGTVWMYVEFSNAHSAYHWCAIDENHLAVPGTSALADAFHRIGIPQAAFTSAEYGWVAIAGTVTAAFDGTATADISLYTAGTAGQFSDITSGAEIEGITLVTAVSTQNQTAEVILSFPHRNHAGSGGASN